MTDHIPSLTDRLPPQNRDAERSVLGSVLRDPDIWADVRAVLSPASFYYDAHQRIFAVIAELVSANQSVDLVTLHAELKRQNWLSDVGGVVYLAELWEAVPTGANAIHHAKLVRDAAVLRGLIHAANEMLREAYSPTGPALEIVASAERKLYELAQSMHGTEGVGARSLYELTQEVLGSIDDRIAAGGEVPGLLTGYTDLDEMLRGLRRGEMAVIGARPSTGKSALAINILERMAVAGSPAVFFSLEMPGRDVAERLLAMGSGVSMHQLSKPKRLTSADITALSQAGSRGGTGGLPIYIDDRPDLSAAQIVSESRSAVRRYGAQAIVVDYLQLMRPENPRENRAIQVGLLAKRLKDMARGLDIPVITLAQLNREPEGTSRRPRISDLRESGDIENHADRILLLHRDSSVSRDQPVIPIEVIIGKNRNGPQGDIRLSFRQAVMRFENYAPDLE